MILAEEMHAPQLAELVGIRLIVAGLASLELDGTQALGDLVDDILQAEQVLLDPFELSHGLDPSAFVSTDARSFVEKRPPLLLRSLEKFTHAPLLDNAVRVGAQACVQEHFLDIAKPGGLFVYEVLALT